MDLFAIGSKLRVALCTKAKPSELDNFCRLKVEKLSATKICKFVQYTNFLAIMKIFRGLLHLSFSSDKQELDSLIIKSTHGVHACESGMVIPNTCSIPGSVVSCPPIEYNEDGS